MSISRIDLNAVGGVAGDMFAAALLDALPELAEPVRADIESLGVAGLSAGTTATVSASLRALRFQVVQPEQPKPPRTLAQVEAFLDGTRLEAEVNRVAIAIYRLLAEAEAAVHGKSIETIHFHEVSDWDSMVDIVTAAGIIARLPDVQWRVGALPLGGGTVKTAHGDIPVPAPATVYLLRGFEWTDDGIAGERVTPTGAAILKYLSPVSGASGLPPATLHAIGSGAGSRNLPGRPNLLRATVFSASGPATDQAIEELAFEVDDMTAEEIAVASDRLRQLDGVLDVASLSLQGKKGRHATGLRILTLPDAVESILAECFLQTSTLGVRRSQVVRRVLHRHERRIDHVAVKLADRGGHITSAKASSDDLQVAPNLVARRQLAFGAEAQAIEHSDHSDD